MIKHNAANKHFADINFFIVKVTGRNESFNWHYVIVFTMHYYKEFYLLLDLVG